MNPYFTLEGFAGIFLFLCSIAFVFFHSNKAKSFQPIDFTVIAMGTVYGLAFPIVIHSAETAGYPGARFIIAANGSYLLHTVFAFITITFVVIGWYSIKQNSFSSLSSFFYIKNVSKIVFWLYAILALAFVTQYLYTIDYGGFVGYFKINRLVRSGLFDLFERSKFSFLSPFGKLSLIAFFGFWGLALSRKAKLLSYIGLFLALSLSVYYLMASAGRVNMLIFIATIIMSIMIYRKTKAATWSFIAPFSVPLCIFFLLFVSEIFNLKAADNANEFIASEFSFPFVGFFAQLESGKNFNLFSDLIVSPAYLLPSSLTYEWLVSADAINTEVIQGSKKGVNGVTGGIPTDVMTYGLMQFHLLGIPIYAFIFGIILRAGSCLSTSFAYKGLTAIFIAYFTIRLCIFGSFYSYPEHIVSDLFPVIFIMVIMFIFKLLKGVRF